VLFYVLFVCKCVLYCCHRDIGELSTTPTEVFPCFFLCCKANARVQLTKMGHGPHFPILFFSVMYVLFCVFCVPFVCKCVLYYCHRVSTKCVLYYCHRVSTKWTLYYCHRVSTKCVLYYCHRVSTKLQSKINKTNEFERYVNNAVETGNFLHKGPQWET
jgi:hypothetical protein